MVDDKATFATMGTLNESVLGARLSDDWKKRKELRKKEYLKQHGKKLMICGACNGSRRYDHNGSPPCGLCQGTGKIRES